MTRVVIMLGGPGAGKGTQAVRLSGELSMPHVSTGDLFRENMSAGTPLGENAREYMEGGRLVPDELVIDMLFDRVAKDDCGIGYVLDGFPRTVPQATALDGRLGPDVNLQAVNIEVPDETIIERISGRLTCKNGHSCHQAFSPPAVDGVCDACGAELFQRDDDHPDVVRERLKVYDEQTRPVVDYYRERDVLCIVDGRPTPDEVFAACLGCLEEVA